MTPRRGARPQRVDFTIASTGKGYDGVAVGNDGTFGWWSAPDTYTATIRPRAL